MRFMGIDLGGTSIRVVVASPDGELLGVGRAAGGNPRSSVGDPTENLATAIAEAGIHEVDAVGVGAAATGGARRAEMLKILDRGLERAGVVAPTVVDTDFAIAFRAASPACDGRLLLAGTGAVAARFERWELVERFDGLGWLLGDTGSGSWIGREALRAVAAAVDGTGPATALVGPVFAHFGIPLDVADPAQALIRATDGSRAAQWAAITRYVVAHSEDVVASQILDSAATALCATLSFAGEGPVILAGGVLQQGPLRERVEQRIGQCAYADHPVVGACALAAAQHDCALDREALNAALE